MRVGFNSREIRSLPRAVTPNAPLNKERRRQNDKFVVLFYLLTFCPKFRDISLRVSRIISMRARSCRKVKKMTSWYFLHYLADAFFWYFSLKICASFFLTRFSLRTSLLCLLSTLYRRLMKPNRMIRSSTSLFYDYSNVQAGFYFTCIPAVFLERLIKSIIYYPVEFL